MVRIVEYVRDKRSPRPSNKNVSKVMSANKGKDTEPELLLRKELWKPGYPRYRLHWKKAPGKPDICYPGRRLAIFVNGCYWHRCPHCDLPMPKSNVGFWEEKFQKNKERDAQKLVELEKAGWKALTLWECQLKDDLEGCMALIDPNLHK